MDDLEDTDIKFHIGLGTFSSVADESTFKESNRDEIISTYSIQNVQPLEYYLNVAEKDRKQIVFEMISVQTVDMIEKTMSDIMFSSSDTYVGHMGFLLGQCRMSGAYLRTCKGSLSLNNIVAGDVVAARKNVLDIMLQCLLTGQKKWIRDLDIMATCETEETSSEPPETIEVGDKVKGVITYIDRIMKKIKISFEDKYLISEFMDHFPLGRLEEEQVEALENMKPKHSQFDDHAFEKDLAASQSFTHPYCIKYLLKDLEIDEKYASFIKRRKNLSSLESLEELREKQSFRYSMKITGIGVQLFRDGKAKEAFEHFDRAITLYPRNIEAFVARGALKANKDKLQEAIRDFRDALLINPKHRNGTSYLIETLLSFAKSHERQSNWKEASKCYKEILSLDGNHLVAKERYQQIQLVISNKILAGSRQHPPASTDNPETKTKTDNIKDKSKEKIKKLRELLIQSKTKEQTSESSSSESSGSSGESSDGWIEKKAYSVKDKNQSEVNSKQHHMSHRERRFGYSERNRAVHSRYSNEKSDYHSRRKEGDFRRKRMDSLDLKRNLSSCIKQDNVNSESSKKEGSLLPDKLSKKLRHFSSAEMDFVSKLLNASKNEDKEETSGTNIANTDHSSSDTKKVTSADKTKASETYTKHGRRLPHRNQHRSFHGKSYRRRSPHSSRKPYDRR